MIRLTLRLFVSLLLLPAVALANSSGILDRAQAGCTGNGCHALVASPTTRVCIEGLPADGTYAPSRTYRLNLFVDGVGLPMSPGWGTAWVLGGHIAGFNFEVTLGSVASADATTWTVARQATHSTSGNARNHWEIDWTAPAAGTVTLFLAGNAVNNSQLNDAGDLWNTVQTTLAPGAGDGIGEGIACNPPLPLPQILPRPIELTAPAAMTAH